MDEKQKGATEANPYLIPVAIIIAGAFIAGGIFLSGNTEQTGSQVGTNEDGHPAGSAPQVSIREVSASEDHIRGNKNAEVMIVEFSDFECPFCQRFHGTMQQVLDEYGDDVAWIYRHFPLTQIHREAQPSAIASECVASLSGNDAFWSFADSLFENQNSLGAGLYSQLAGELGISSGEFESCILSSEISGEIGKDVQEALESGARGTPFSVILNEDGVVGTIPGALPFENVKPLIDQALDR
tara:strand:+ start:4956 stop:5678 length:723 start_codon:yes stop_codon:yes gene_type:complete